MSKTNYRPLFGRVLIRREITEKTAGGIILPNAKKHAKLEGVIIALGPTAGWTRTYDKDGAERLANSLEIGQKVIFGAHAGKWLDATKNIKGDENDDGTLFICQDEDLLAVIEQGE